MLAENAANADFYDCLNGAWNKLGGGGAGSSGTVFSAITFGAVCDGSHLSADTTGIKAAITAAKAVGGTAYIPKGTCQFDNSAGAYVVSAFTGAITGDGKASSIACNTMASDCFDFNSATNLSISNLSFSFSGSTTTRGGGYPLNIDSSSNVLLQNNYFNNGDLSGVRIGNSSNVRAIGNTITNFLANGFFTLNNLDLHFENTTCSNNADACEEYSYYDTGTQAACSRITSTGMTSTNDLSGFLINSCSQVSVSNFAITGGGHEGISVLQDATTTTLVFPDQVQISNGTITNAGYGSNVSNRNTAQGIVISIAGAPATFQNINISNVSMKHIAGRGIELGDSGTVNLTGSNIRIDDAGNGNTSATAEGVYLDGNVVKLTGLYVSNAGTYSFRNHLGVYVSLTDYTSVNPNQLGAATNGTLNEANGDYFSLNGATIVDTFAGSNRSGISSTASTGVQTISNVTTLCTVTCNSSISVTNSSGINSAGFQNLGVTTATNGWIGQNGNRLLHTFGGVTELFLGTNAGSFSVTGVNNVGIGDAALAANTSGQKNTAVGAFAMNAVISGTQNTAVGNSAYNVGTGSSSVVVGSGALSAQTAGNNSTAVGAFALSLSTGTGPNTCIGENCLAGITTGSQNFGAGVNAGNIFDTATKTVSIGDSVNSAGTHNLVQSSCVGFGCQNALSNEVRYGSSSEFQDFPGTAGVELTATGSLTAGQAVKIDSANASSVVVTATGDTGGGIAIGLVNNAPGAAGVAMVATSGIRNAVLGTGTCSIGNFVIVDTTTAGRVKCTGTYAAGTVIGVALTAQASVGSAVSVMIGLR